MRTVAQHEADVSVCSSEREGGEREREKEREKEKEIEKKHALLSDSSLSHVLPL